MQKKQQLSFNSVDGHLPVAEFRPSDDRRSGDSLFATVASRRQGAFEMEEARGNESEEAREAATGKAVVIIVLRGDCSSTCELSVRISAAHRTAERGNIPRRYICAAL